MPQHQNKRAAEVRYGKSVVLLQSRGKLCGESASQLLFSGLDIKKTWQRGR